MIEYKYVYKKYNKCKKFTENGHTMFETDVLQRLKRLAYLEEQIKTGELTKSNEQAQPEALGIGAVSGSFAKRANAGFRSIFGDDIDLDDGELLTREVFSDKVRGEIHRRMDGIREEAEEMLNRVNKGK